MKPKAIKRAREIAQGISFATFCWGMVSLYIFIRFVIPLFYTALTNSAEVLSSLGVIFADSVKNVADNLLAGLGFALLVWFSRDIVRKFLEPDKRTLTTHFHDVHSLVEVLYDASSRFATRKGDATDMNNIRKSHIFFASPLAISDKYIDYVCAPDDPMKLETKAKLMMFNDLLSHISEQTDGAFDVYVTGKTEIASIDQATCDMLSRRYFIKNNKKFYFPGTSELGYHNNLNEYAAFIFGECDPMNPGTHPLKVYDIVMVLFNKNFRKLHGYACSDDEVVKIGFSFHEFRITECKDAKMYFSNTDSEKKSGDDVDKFEAKLIEFFYPPTSVSSDHESDSVATISAN